MHSAPILKNENAPNLTVVITPEHITGAMRKNSNRCMIAEAVIDAYPNASYVRVDAQAIRFSDLDKQRRYIYYTPQVAQVAIIDFDGGVRRPKPFTFKLRGHGSIVHNTGWAAQRKYTMTRKGRKSRARARSAQETRVIPASKRQFGLCILPQNA